MKKITFSLIFFVLSFNLNAQKITVKLSIKESVGDSLILSVAYTNNTNKPLSIVGFSSIEFENFYPTRANTIFSKQQVFPTKYYEGFENDTISLFFPITNEKNRYLLRYNGDIMDVFGEISEQKIIAETYSLFNMNISSFSQNDSVLYSNTFLDKELFNNIWEQFHKSIEKEQSEFILNCQDIIIISPQSTKEIYINVSYLLFRECVYKLQVNDKQDIIDSDRIGLDYVKKNFRAKHYNKKLTSNVLYISTIHSSE